MTPDPYDRLRTALYEATREVHKAHDTIAGLQVQLAAREVELDLARAHIGRLQDMLLHEGRPEHKCQQRTGDSTI